MTGPRIKTKHPKERMLLNLAVDSVGMFFDKELKILFLEKCVPEVIETAFFFKFNIDLSVHDNPNDKEFGRKLKDKMEEAIGAEMELRRNEQENEKLRLKYRSKYASKHNQFGFINGVPDFKQQRHRHQSLSPDHGRVAPSNQVFEMLQQRASRRLPERQQLHQLERRVVLDVNQRHRNQSLSPDHGRVARSPEIAVFRPPSDNEHLEDFQNDNNSTSSSGVFSLM